MSHVGADLKDLLETAYTDGGRAWTPPGDSWWELVTDVLVAYFRSLFADTIEVLPLTDGVTLNPAIRTTVLTGELSTGASYILPAGEDGARKTIIVTGITLATPFVEIHAFGFGQIWTLNPVGSAYVSDLPTNATLTVRYSAGVGAWIQDGPAINFSTSGPVGVYGLGTQVWTDSTTVFGNGTSGSPLSAFTSPFVLTYDAVTNVIDPTLDVAFLTGDDNTFTLADGTVDGHQLALSVNYRISVGTLLVTASCVGGSFTLDVTDTSILPAGAVLVWNATTEVWEPVSILNMTYT